MIIVENITKHLNKKTISSAPKVVKWYYSSIKDEYDTQKDSIWNTMYTWTSLDDFLLNILLTEITAAVSVIVINIFLPTFRP